MQGMHLNIYKNNIFKTKIKNFKAPTQIRLAGGPNATSGRLEIKRFDIWGTICDDDFNSGAATVACRYLSANFHSLLALNTKKFAPFFPRTQFFATINFF